MIGSTVSVGSRTVACVGLRSAAAALACSCSVGAEVAGALTLATVAALDVTDSGLSDLVTQLADDNGGVKWHN